LGWHAIGPYNMRRDLLSIWAIHNNFCNRKPQKKSTMENKLILAILTLFLFSCQGKHHGKLLYDTDGNLYMVESTVGESYKIKQVNPEGYEIYFRSKPPVETDTVIPLPKQDSL
jgi:hypothetical protein